MPPRKSKAKKATDSQAQPRRSTRGSKAAVEDVPSAPEASTSEHDVSSEALQSAMPPTVSDVAAAVTSIVASVVQPAPTSVAPEEKESLAMDETPAEVPDIEMDATGSVTTIAIPEPSPVASLTMEQRLAKLDELRLKMRSTAQANRTDLLEEHQRQKTTARDLARLDKQRRLAAVLREKAEAEENGLDTERKKNWEYSIEENDEWEKRLKRKTGRADFQFHDAADAARKKYKKDLDQLKPDLAAYTRQKEAALGLVPGALSRAGSSKDTSLIQTSSAASALASEDLYRDANTLSYGDNKPTDDAIDRVVAKLNNDIDKRGKFSRKRLNEEEGDITYINEHNKVFNKKISRYYDKYTKEIRDSFERGTAL